MTATAAAARPIAAAEVSLPEVVTGAVCERGVQDFQNLPLFPLPTRDGKPRLLGMFQAHFQAPKPAERQEHILRAHPFAKGDASLSDCLEGRFIANDQPDHRIRMT